MRFVYALLSLAVTLLAQDRSRLLEQYNQLPLAFEPNLGQTVPEAQFIARSSGYTLLLTPAEAVMVLAREKSGAAVRMKLSGAAPKAVSSAEETQAGVSAYFLGNDPSRWLPEVPHYSRVRYRSVYPGIDLVYYGNARQVEYDFIVSPGADPGRIAISYEGAERIHIDGSGDVVLTTPAGELRQRKPRVFQEINGRQVEIGAAYRLRRGKVLFALAAYDRRRPLRIDPVLIYSTYFGGNTRIHSMAVDSTGAVYLAGLTVSPTFPTANAYQSSFGSSQIMLYPDAFVTKLNPYSGSGPVTLAYSTYLGGPSTDTASSIAVDPAGGAYITGLSTSANFPVLNAYQTAPPPGTASYVAKLNPYSGSGKVTLAYSTYIGPGFFNGIAADSNGAAYVVGSAGTNTFPSLNGFRTIQQGDAIVVRLNPYESGNVTLGYATSLGTGSGQAVAVDPSNAVYFAGTTVGGLLTANALQAAPGGSIDAFVAKIGPFTGGPVSLIYSTYLGGNNTDNATAITTDATGAAYVAGVTRSPDFPVVAAFRTQHAGNGDAFVTKLNPYSGTGSVSMGFSTYLGGAASDFGFAIAVDSASSVYVAGSSQSANFPVLDRSPLIFGGPIGDAFITKFNQPGGGAPPVLAFSTLFGGTDVRVQGSALPDTATGIAVDSTGAVQIAGYTHSPIFPLQNPFQSTYIDVVTDAILDSDGFVARLAPPGTVVKTPVNITVGTPTAGPAVAVYGQPVVLTATVTGAGAVPATGPVYFVGSYTGAVLCFATISNGVATCTAVGSSELQPGVNTITVGYPGDATYTLGNVTPLLLTVNRASTTTSVAVVPPGAGPGTNVTLNATVAISPPGHVFSTPIGSVTFTNNGVPIPACVSRQLTGYCYQDCPTLFQVTCLTTLTGDDHFAAVYNGDVFTSPSTAPTVNVTFAPAPVAVSPTTGAGTMTRTFIFSDPAGWQDLGVVNILINDFLDGRRACYLAFNRPLNTLYLVNDNGDGLLPGLTLNGTGSLSNSQCTISGPASAAVGNGNSLTLTLNISFSNSFAGARIVYMAARSVTEQNSGWQPLGTWQVPGPPPPGPIAVTGMTPPSGTGLFGNFVFAFSDTRGSEDIGVVNILVNSALDGGHACYIAYARATNTIYLGNDAGTAFSGMPLNGTGTLSNSQCTVNVTGSTGLASGVNLFLTLNLTFNQSFAGNRIFYLAARNNLEGDNTGWQAAGAWRVQ